MRNLILITLIASVSILFSCSKKEGCNDRSATNFIKVDKDDGSCIYTKLIFYADSTSYPSAEIDHINIEVNSELVGTFSQAYNGVINCDNPPPVSATYQMPNAGEINWKSKVHLINGSIIYLTGKSAPSNTEKCRLINVL